MISIFLKVKSTFPELRDQINVEIVFIYIYISKQISLFLMSNAKGDVMQNKMSLFLHPNRFGEI